MQDLSRVLGSPVHVAVGGKSIAIAMMTLADIAYVQSVWRSRRKQEVIDSVAAFKDLLDAKQLFEMAQQARKESLAVADPTMEELQAFMSGLDGATVLIRRLIERANPGEKITDDEVTAIMRDLQSVPGRLESLMTELQGGDAGNSTGPTTTETPVAKPVNS